MNITEMEFIRRMSPGEIQFFTDRVTAIVVDMQPLAMGVTLDDIADRVIGEEASRMALRQGIERDMAGRFQSRAPMEAVHEESGDPAEALSRVVKKKMTETPSLSYGEALKQAQMEHRDLAAQILKQLNEYRAR
jgi:hypothetical protein